MIFAPIIITATRGTNSVIHPTKYVICPRSVRPTATYIILLRRIRASSRNVGNILTIVKLSRKRTLASFHVYGSN